MRLLFLALFILCQETWFVVGGGGFGIKVSELQMDEMSVKMDEMSVAIMGMAEYIQEIKHNVEEMRAGLGQMGKPFKMSSKTSRGLTVDELLKREELAQKIERLFRNDNKTRLEAVKEEMTTVVETNFIKMLGAILLTGPVQAQDRTPEILRVMRNVLNKELDLRPIIDRLPFLVRNTETNQFIVLLKALRDNERGDNGRQFGGLEDLGKVIDAAGKLDLKQVSGFLKEIPEIFESIETIVDGVDLYL